MFEGYLLSKTGKRLAVLGQFDLDAGLSLNGVGAIKVTLAAASLPKPLLDMRLAIYRRIGEQQKLLGGTTWLIRKIGRSLDQSGRRELTLWAEGPNTLLKRRWVAYPANSDQTHKLGPADDMMKAVVRENMGNLAAVIERDWSVWLRVANDSGRGPVVEKEMAWRQVLAVLQEIGQVAEAAGTAVYFDIAAISEQQFEFRTYIGLRGVDRSRPGNIGFVVLSPENGSVVDGDLDWDGADEATWVYAAGQGTGDSRLIGEAGDNGRIASSPFGRIEIVEQTNNIGTQEGLDEEAIALLQARRPRRLVKLSLADAPGLQAGIHYDLGDKVAWIFEGDGGTAIVETMKYRQKSGKIEIDAELRTDADDE